MNVIRKLAFFALVGAIGATAGELSARNKYEPVIEVHRRMLESLDNRIWKLENASRSGNRAARLY